MDLDRLEELAKDAPNSPYDKSGQWHADWEHRLDDLQRSIEPTDMQALIKVVRAAQDVRDSGASLLAMSALSEALAAVESTEDG